VPFRAQLLVKTLCLVILFSSGLPVLMPLLLLYCCTAWPCDRIHFLARYAPPPLTNDLSLRFVIGVILPPFIALHSVLGAIFYVSHAAAQTLD